MESKQPEKEIQTSSQPAVEDSEEEENEILEESPCGRWLKRTEEVEQNNIPGIDATYLAMDTEDGVEVVWNEVRFSERKYFKAKEETINTVFDRLIQLEHPNIVKLHKYWLDKESETPRVIFITEYMSSGSLKQFIQKTKRHVTALQQNWRRWCTQTLSALCYLHSSQPAIVHGNLNCDTIFISYNGLIKIGAIAPDSIHRYVKTVRSDSRSNLHFIAPELGMSDGESSLSPAIDIYAFGMCALEMAALEITSGDESNHHITEQDIQRTIDLLDNPMQKDFIQRCLQKDPLKRPTARELLFHPIIFEVPSLRLFCAHSILKNPSSSLQPEQLTEEAISRFLSIQNQSDKIVAEVPRLNQASIVFRLSDFPNHELEKFLEEVKNGALPLTAVCSLAKPPHVSRQKTISPEVIDDAHKLINTPEYPYDEETRRVIYINCCIQPLTIDGTTSDVKLIMKLDDKINRQLTCEITQDDFIPLSIAQELVYYGFINKEDKDSVANVLLEAFNESQVSSSHAACCEKTLIAPKGQPSVPAPVASMVLAQPVPIIPSPMPYQIPIISEPILSNDMNNMTLGESVVIVTETRNGDASLEYQQANCETMQTQQQQQFGPNVALQLSSIGSDQPLQQVAPTLPTVSSIPAQQHNNNAELVNQQSQSISFEQTPIETQHVQYTPVIAIQSETQQQQQQQHSDGQNYTGVGIAPTHPANLEP